MLSIEFIKFIFEFPQFFILLKRWGGGLVCLCLLSLQHGSQVLFYLRELLGVEVGCNSIDFADMMEFLFELLVLICQKGIFFPKVGIFLQNRFEFFLFLAQVPFQLHILAPNFLVSVIIEVGLFAQSDL